MSANVVTVDRPKGINFQVEGCFPVQAAGGQDAGLIIACTEL